MNKQAIISVILMFVQNTVFGQNLTAKDMIEKSKSCKNASMFEHFVNSKGFSYASKDSGIDYHEWFYLSDEKSNQTSIPSRPSQDVSSYLLDNSGNVSVGFKTNNKTEYSLLCKEFRKMGFQNIIDSLATITMHGNNKIYIYTSGQYPNTDLSIKVLNELLFTGEKWICYEFKIATKTSE